MPDFELPSVDEFPLLRIGSHWRISSDGAFRPVINPGTGDVIGEIPAATTDDLAEVARVSAAAFVGWRQTSPVERGAILRNAAALLRANDAAIAPLITRENGKTLAESKAEVHWACDYLEWYAEEARRTYGRVIPAKMPGVRQIVVREPVGPVLGLTPWNWPLVTAARKVGPALAAGCTITVKPAEETPTAAAILLNALLACGLPDGVANLVNGDPALISETLIAAPEIRKISFTGSVRVGRHLATLAAQQLKLITLELGGHAPVLIFEDADIESAIAKLIPTKFRTCGQVCSSPTRYIVHESVAAKFTALFAAAAGALTIGNGAMPGSEMGPLISARRLAAVGALVDDAVAKGARIVTGGHRIGETGFFYAPTVLADVPANALILEEEPFGPVVPIQTFATYEEAIALARHASLGLSSYAFTKSLKIAQRLSSDLECGMLGVNSLAVSMAEAPFGGFKDSGFGKEGGIEGIDAYMQSKFVVEAID